MDHGVQSMTAAARGHCSYTFVNGEWSITNHCDTQTHHKCADNVDTIHGPVTLHMSGNRKVEFSATGMRFSKSLKDVEVRVPPNTPLVSEPNTNTLLWRSTSSNPTTSIDIACASVGGAPVGDQPGGTE